MTHQYLAATYKSNVLFFVLIQFRHPVSEMLLYMLTFILMSFVNLLQLRYLTVNFSSKQLKRRRNKWRVLISMFVFAGSLLYRAIYSSLEYAYSRDNGN